MSRRDWIDREGRERERRGKGQEGKRRQRRGEERREERMNNFTIEKTQKLE